MPPKSSLRSSLIYHLYLTEWQSLLLWKAIHAKTCFIRNNNYLLTRFRLFFIVECWYNFSVGTSRLSCLYTSDITLHRKKFLWDKQLILPWGLVSYQQSQWQLLSLVQLTNQDLHQVSSWDTIWSIHSNIFKHQLKLLHCSLLCDDRTKLISS